MLTAPNTRRLTGVTLLATALLTLGFAGLLAGAGPAAAHSQVQTITPAPGSTVNAPPKTLRLTFNEALLAGTGQVKVTGPDAAVVTTGPVQIAGRVLSASLPAATADWANGRYTVQWRVTSGDGHPVAGQFTFTLTAAAPSPTISTPVSPTVSTPSPSPSALPATEATAGTTPSPTSVPVLGAVVAALIVAAGAFAWSRRTRR